MALKFNPLKTKVKKNDGSYIFGDFSHGLYLLDTPRAINEQLASLALTGGRNIWAEKGALVPQFGYMPLAQLPEGEIVAQVTRDSYSSSSFFIITYSGKVYLYTSNQGLKEFKTTLPTVDNPIVAHRGNDLIINTEGNNYIFGTYESSVEQIVTDENVPVNDYSTYYTFRVPTTSEKYYWNGKQISVDNTYQMNVNSVTRTYASETFNRDGFDIGTYTNLTIDSKGYLTWRGMAGQLKTQPAVDISSGSFSIKIPTYVNNTMGTIEYALGNNAVGNRITVSSGSNGTNIFISLALLDSNDEVVRNVTFSKRTPYTFTGNHNLILSYDEDTSKFKLEFETSKNVIETIEEIEVTEEWDYIEGLDNLQIITKVNGSFGDSITIDLKQFLIKSGDTTVFSGIQSEEGDHTIIRATYVQGGDVRPSLTGTVTLGEKTIKNISLVYEAESGTTGNKTLEPELFAIANNRLFVVDMDGGIYYSAIGVIDEFHQSQGAGYFSGFYSDTSKTLSIEDFMDGVLICKENGIYYLTLTSSDIQIKKIANIGQESANDHVIVREAVYAYDTNSGSIVNAASVNVFGSLVAGNTIIDSTYLDSQGRGISSSPRWLTYNGLENVMILYYGEDYSRGIVLNLNSNLYPRELDIPVKYFIGFNQSVTGITETGMIFQDFKNGTIIEGLAAYADFEAIGLRDNRMICSSILEVTELNGVDYIVSTRNSGVSVQNVQPVIGLTAENQFLPELIYSDYSKQLYNNSFELVTRWADKKASLTRIYAPMSGRDGVGISIEFPKNVAFCLAALRLPDFSQGE